MNVAMDYQKTIETLSPEVYQRLLRAVELGKWPDGKVVTAEQRAHAMQAIIAWGEQHLPEEERVGFVEKKAKAGEQCDTPSETPLKWRE
ncbi:Uncharacterised protein [Halioglobus japonicus]|nr:Uncharacterised protein [Halioglobus japonicus]